MFQKARSTLAILFGLAIIIITIWYVIIGVKHPSSDKSIAIALLSAIGVPIALAAITVGYRGLRRPHSWEIRTELEAKGRAAAALEDAETAEQIKAELEAYVAVRTWRLEIERKRQEMSRAADAVLEMQRELVESETRLGIEQTKLSPATVATLDSLLKPTPVFQFPDFYPFNTPAVKFGTDFLNWSYEHLQRRRMRQMARVAPMALVEQNGDRPGPDPNIASEPPTAG